MRISQHSTVSHLFWLPHLYFLPGRLYKWRHLRHYIIASCFHRAFAQRSCRHFINHHQTRLPKKHPSAANGAEVQAESERLRQGVTSCQDAAPPPPSSLPLPPPTPPFPSPPSPPLSSPPSPPTANSVLVWAAQELQWLLLWREANVANIDVLSGAWLFFTTAVGVGSDRRGGGSATTAHPLGATH